MPPTPPKAWQSLLKTREVPACCRGLLADSNELDSGTECRYAQCAIFSLRAEAFFHSDGSVEPEPTPTV
jgi:hypothetical protein